MSGRHIEWILPKHKIASGSLRAACNDPSLDPCLNMFNMVYTCLYKVTTCIYTQLSLSFFWRLRQRPWHRLGNRCLSQCQDPQADPTNPRLSTWTEVGRLTHPSRAKKNLQEIWETTPGPRPQRGPGEKMPGNKKHKIQEIHVLTKLACLVLRSFATPQSEIFAYVYLLVFQGFHKWGHPNRMCF